MKQMLWVTLLLFLLSTNIVACAKEDLIFPPNNEHLKPPINMGENIQMVVGSVTFTVTLNDNASAAAFKAMLPLTLNMGDFNSNEKVCSLPDRLPTNASNYRAIQAGDIMLYGSSSLVLFYETFSTSYSYTRIGRVNNSSGLKAALGTGSVTVQFN